jgi:hypothetical protein
MAAVDGGLEILEEVWELAYEKLTTAEINNLLLLLTDNKEKPSFIWQHMMAD